MGTWKRDYRDEDLALFHDMRRRERKNFLILSAEDGEASPMSTPTRTGRELLAVDSEKNDFDWLLTPPSTPLFPSLDRDGPAVNLSQRRVFTRSSSISRTTRLSSTQEPSPKVAHCGNPSLKQPGTAGSMNSTLSASRGRQLSPSFTSRSSPTVRSSSPCRPVTPTQRSSAASCKSSSRSLTPTLQRNNTSPSYASKAGNLSGRSRGKSLSPKPTSWEPSLSGFLAEPPPNLRTCLSDRTIQRGVSRVPKNKPKTRSSSADLFDGGCQSRWHLDSPDGPRNWSSSYSLDHSSSHNSRASIMSYDDDMEMAESVLSCSTHSEGTSNGANSFSSKMEEASLRRSVLPAKRHIRSGGLTEDPTLHLSVAVRKSYERQPVQRRSAQAMFRPLLSSAPITSFYGNRTSVAHSPAVGPFIDSSAVQSTGSSASGEEKLLTKAASQVKCESVCGCQETINEENEGSSISEQEQTAADQKGCCQLANEVRSTGLNVQSEKTADGCKIGTSVSKEKDLLISTEKETPCVPVEDINLVPAQCSMQFGPKKHVFPEDIECDVGVDVTGSVKSTDCFVRERHTNQKKVYCADEHETSCTLVGVSRKIEHMSSESRLKDDHADDERLTYSGKTPASFLGIGNALQKHGSQRVPSDLGSFRKLNVGKALHAHSHDCLPSGVKNESFESFTSASCSLTQSVASAVGSGQSVDFGNVGCSMVGTVHSGSISTVESGYYHSERVLQNDLSKIGVPFCNTSPCNQNDAYKGNVVAEGFNTGTATVSLPTSSHMELWSLDMHSTSVPSANVSCQNSENLQYQAAEIDKAAHRDTFPRIGSSVPQFSNLDRNEVHCGLTEEFHRDLSSRPPEACTAVAPAVESSHADDLIPKQSQGVLLSKRSVTLEEATDTILFCSSVAHELVYKAAGLAIEREEQRITKPSISKRDFVALFGFSGAEDRLHNGGNRLKAVNGARSHVRQRSHANASVFETSSFVQKQRMIHRQTPALTLQQNPMERIENAVMGTHEEIQAPKLLSLSKKENKERRRAWCRCSCCMM